LELSYNYSFITMHDWKTHSSNSLSLTQDCLKVSLKVQFWERYCILSFVLLHWWTFPSNIDQMNFHFHKDGFQPCISLESYCTNDADRGKTSMDACMCSWYRSLDGTSIHIPSNTKLFPVNSVQLLNLKLETWSTVTKPEVLVFPLVIVQDQTVVSWPLFNEVVNSSSTVPILGNSLLMVPHITVVCKSAFFHLHNISTIRFLNTETTKTLVHTFVTSKVDYWDSFLYGVPKYLLKRLQRVLNCVGRILFKSNKFDHIAPLPKEILATHQTTDRI